MLYYLGLAFLAVITIPSMGQAQQHFSSEVEALKLFNKYKPVIERKNNSIVQNPVAIIGDINGDGKDDCIISFVMASRNGGNAIIGHQSAIYLNIGTGMKVVGAFPEFHFCYTLDHIHDQVIFGKEYECMPPYNNIQQERKFSFVNGKIKEIF
jgi:hypothetical protein